jgi:transposase
MPRSSELPTLPKLPALIEGLRREIATLKQEVTRLQQENVALKQEVADLRRQLGQDSHNSSKPPRVAGSLRGVADKQSGGQIGHRGDTLRRTEQPDIIQRYTATCCQHCRAPLTAAMACGVEQRQVFELPEPRLEVTEYQA